MLLHIAGIVLSACFAGAILTEPLWHKTRRIRKKQLPTKKAVLNSDMNPLPENIDWQEVNTVIFPHWKSGIRVMNQLVAPLNSQGKMTTETRRVLGCLHDDIMWFYTNRGGYGAEYDEMESYIRTKYKGLDENCIG